MEFSNDPSTMELKMNQAHLRGTGENVTFIHSILLIPVCSGPLSAVVRGCREPRGQHQLQEAWVPGPFPDAARVERTEPARTHGSPAWATSPGHSSTIEMRLLPLEFGAPLDLGGWWLVWWTLESDLPGLAS